MIHKFVGQFMVFVFLLSLVFGGVVPVVFAGSQGSDDWKGFGIVLNATVLIGRRVYSGMMVYINAGGRMNISVGCNCLKYYLYVMVFENGPWDTDHAYPLTIPWDTCIMVHDILVNGTSVKWVVLGASSPFSGSTPFYNQSMPSTGELKPVNNKTTTTTTTPSPPESETLKLLSYVAVAGIAAIVSSLATYLALSKRRS